MDYALTSKRCSAFAKTLLAAASLTAVLAGPARAETLTDALIGAFNHSGLLEQNRALLRAADEDVAIAMSALRPIINWSGSVARNFSRSASQATGGRTTDTSNTAATIGISASLVLYDFGQSRFAIEAAKETVLSTRQRLIAVEQNVLLRAISAFMNVRRAIEIVAVRQANVRVITQELRAARDRFDVGEVTRTDVALAEARLASARSLLASAEGDYLQASEEYRAAVGRKPGRLSAPSGLPKTANSVDQAKAIAVRTHPEMKAAQHDVAAADLNVARAEAAVNPTVSLSSGLSVTENFNSTSFQRGGNVSITAKGPIYQGGRLSAVQRQAMARRDAARSGLHIVRHQIEQNVGNAFAQLRVARASRDASERQIRAARVA
ncbi:MAG: TolC family outer membrane protein, partial [Pseudomonadota bacterium]